MFASKNDFKRGLVGILIGIFSLSVAGCQSQQKQPKPQKEKEDQAQEQMDDLEQKINNLTNKIESSGNTTVVQTPALQDPRMQMLQPNTVVTPVDPRVVTVTQRAKEKLLSDKLRTISGIGAVDNIMDRDRIFVALVLAAEYDAMEVENIKNQARAMVIRNYPEILKQYIITEPNISKEIMQLTAKLDQGAVITDLVQKLNGIENELMHIELEQKRMEKYLKSDIKPEMLVKSLKESVEGIQDAAVVLYNNQAYVGIRTKEKPKSDKSMIAVQKAKEHVRKQALYLRDVKATDSIEIFQALKDLMTEKDIGRLNTTIQQIDYKLLHDQGL